MSTFDVFVKGIQPNKTAETPKIIEELSKVLKTNAQKAEKILSTPNTRISRSVSKKQAEVLQLTLSKIGVICLYKPSSGGRSLSLEPIEKRNEKALDACPSCHHEFADKLSVPPEKCESCGVYIEKFIRIAEEDGEKEKIREKIREKESMRTSREQNVKDEATEDLRKKILEQAILNENSQQDKNKSKKNQKYVLIAAPFILAAVGYASYNLLGQKDNTGIEVAEVDEVSTSKIMPVEETFEEGEMLAVGIPETSEEEVVSATTFSENDDLVTEIPLSSSSNVALQSGQGVAEPQQSHAQASKVLDSFGLDANAFNQSGSSSINGSQQALQNMPLQVGQMSGAFDLETKISHKNVSDSAKKNSNGVLTSFLSDFGADKHERERFLTQKIEYLIINNQFDSAMQSIQHLSEMENFITLSEKLAKKSKQSNLNIETKIQSAPQNMQAQYLSRWALHQNNKESAGALFNKAEKSWKTIQDPHKQLLSALKIAVSYFKAGSSSSANRYFGKIKTLLAVINTVENQISARVAISRAFSEVGQQKIALNWLKSTEKFINKANLSNLHELVERYAFLNQKRKVSSIVAQITSSSHKDGLTYKAISAFLKSGQNENANVLVESMEDPINKALGYVLLANYLKHDSSHLKSAEGLLGQSVNGAIGKTIVSSRIAQQYARQNNASKANELFQVTDDFIKKIPLSVERDEALEIIIKNYAFPLNKKPVKILLSYIESSETKNRINETIWKGTVASPF